MSNLRQRLLVPGTDNTPSGLYQIGRVAVRYRRIGIAVGIKRKHGINDEQGQDGANQDDNRDDAAPTSSGNLVISEIEHLSF